MPYIAIAIPYIAIAMPYIAIAMPYIAIAMPYIAIGRNHCHKQETIMCLIATSLAIFPLYHSFLYS